MLRKIYDGVAALSAAGLLATVFLLFINVIGRRCFGSSITWIEEITNYVIVWMVFLAGGTLALNGGHVKIEAFILRLNKKLQSRWVAFLYWISAALCTYLFFLSLDTMLLVMDTGQKSPAGGLPIWAIYLGIALGFILMAVAFAVTALKTASSKK